MSGALGFSNIENVLTENRTRSSPQRWKANALWPLRHQSPMELSPGLVCSNKTYCGFFILTWVRTAVFTSLTFRVFIFIWRISCKSSFDKWTVLSHLFRHLRQHTPFHTIHTTWMIYWQIRKKSAEGAVRHADWLMCNLLSIRNQLAVATRAVMIGGGFVTHHQKNSAYTMGRSRKDPNSPHRGNFCCPEGEGRKNCFW